VISLALTLAIELPLLWAVLWFLFRLRKESIPLRLVVFAGLMASCLTLPYFWFILPVFIRTYVLFAIVSEATVIILETVIYWFVLKLSIKVAPAASVICNVVSFFTGELVKAIW
jgi:hypothetical protein